MSLPAHIPLSRRANLGCPASSRDAAHRLPPLRGHQAVDREWEKLGYQDAILKLYHDNAERGLRRVRPYARAGRSPPPPPPHRAPPAPPARRRQRRAASRRRWPAHPGRPPAWWQETAPDPPPCHLVGLAAAKVEGARHACPAARPPGAAPPPAAGRWQAASRRPGGPPPPRCLAEVVPRTHPRIPVDQQPGSQKRRPPAAQEPTGPGQALAGQLVLPAGTFALSRKAWAEPSKVEALPRRRRQRST